MGPIYPLPWLMQDLLQPLLCLMLHSVCPWTCSGEIGGVRMEKWGGDAVERGDGIQCVSLLLDPLPPSVSLPCSSLHPLLPPLFPYQLWWGIALMYVCAANSREVLPKWPLSTLCSIGNHFTTVGLCSAITKILRDCLLHLSSDRVWLKGWTN